MNAAIYWRFALGLFWAFLFFMLLVLVVGMTYLSKEFYPYAIFLSTMLVIFLAAFLLFGKRIRAGFYLCIALSALFIANQLLTLYTIFINPAGILAGPSMQRLLGGQENLFPAIVSALLLLWGILLLFASIKSGPVFRTEMQKQQLAWLTQIKKEIVEKEKPLQSGQFK